MSSFEKAVKGATKIKLAPPKSKYIESILNGTRMGEGAVAEIFRTLQLRIRDSTWTIAFKALIVTHLMIREGEPDSTLAYLAQNYRKLIVVTNYSDVQTQGKNIISYSNYLVERAKSYNKTRQDYVGGAQNRLKKLSVDKGLLRECESVQAQIQALVRCDLFGEEPENEISLTAFRLLVMDLLVLFQVMNEGTINVLERYFEMSRPDAERALAIYKTFARQTDLVVRYLSLARQYEYSTRIEIPKIKHAPTSLAASLEEYLNDRDFETNRRQYLAQQDAKKGIKPGGLKKSFTEPPAGASKPSFPSPKQSTSANVPPPTKGPAPDLIDFFESIEQKQQPMATQPSQFPSSAFDEPSSAPPQQTGFAQPLNGYGNGQNQPNFTGNNPFGQFQQPQSQYQQPQNQFQQPQNQYQQPQMQYQQTSNQQVQMQPQQQQQQSQIQPQYTGAGFGGYTPQPQSPQQQTSPYGQFTGNQSFNQQPASIDQAFSANQQASNPFRQSSMPTSFSQTPQATGNPFARSTPPMQSTPFQPPPATYQTQSQQIMPQQTGTNPFARSSPASFAQAQDSSQTPVGSVFSQATGSTNPFKQSTFVNQQTGEGWQNGPQHTMGGLEQLETVPIFPRPGQQPPQQQSNPWA